MNSIHLTLLAGSPVVRHLPAKAGHSGLIPDQRVAKRDRTSRLNTTTTSLVLDHWQMITVELHVTLFLLQVHFFRLAHPLVYSWKHFPTPRILLKLGSVGNAEISQCTHNL